MAEDSEGQEQEDTMEDDPEDLLDGDEIDDREEGFMQGYDDVETKEESDDVKEDDSSSTAGGSEE